MSSRILVEAAKGAASGDAHLCQVLDALPVAVYTTDASGSLTFYNSAAAALWGCRPELGTVAWSGAWKLCWLDGREIPPDEHPIAVALRERRPVHGLEITIERPDGSRVPVMPHPTPLFDGAGQVIGGVNLVLEVTDRRLAGEYAARLTSIVESSDDAIISIGLDTIIASWNGGAERLFGYAASEVIGKSVVMLLPLDRAEEEVDILRRICAGEHVDHFQTVRQCKDGSLVDISLTVSPVKDMQGRVVGASKVARDVTDQKRAQEQQVLLVHEMQHRIKNTLTVVQAIASQTMRSASREDHAAFVGRLQTLAAAQNLLTVENWKRVPLREVIDRSLAAFQGQRRQRVDVEGPDGVWLNAGRIFSLSMALHELATNAAKYGALSNETGRVRIGWEIENSADQTRLVLSWRESGGPPVAPPATKGFGSLLLDRAIEGDLDTTRLTYHPSGVECLLEMSL